MLFSFFIIPLSGVNPDPVKYLSTVLPKFECKSMKNLSTFSEGDMSVAEINSWYPSVIITLFLI